MHHQNLPSSTLCLCVSLYWILEDLLLCLWFIHSEVNIYMNHLWLSILILSMPCCQNLVSTKCFCMGRSARLTNNFYCVINVPFLCICQISTNKFTYNMVFWLSVRFRACLVTVRNPWGLRIPHDSLFSVSLDRKTGSQGFQNFRCISVGFGNSAKILGAEDFGFQICSFFCWEGGGGIGFCVAKHGFSKYSRKAISFSSRILLPNVPLGYIWMLGFPWKCTSCITWK